GARGGHTALQLQALVCRAPVVPEYGRAQRPIFVIQKGRPVHLPAQTHGSDGRARAARQTFHGVDGCLPPRLRVLLREPRLRPAHDESIGGLSDDDATVINQHCLHARRADIYSQVHLTCSNHKLLSNRITRRGDCEGLPPGHGERWCCFGTCPPLTKSPGAGSGQRTTGRDGSAITKRASIQGRPLFWAALREIPLFRGPGPAFQRLAEESRLTRVKFMKCCSGSSVSPRRRRRISSRSSSTALRAIAATG